MLQWWVEQDSNLRRHKPADLQSALVDRLSIHPGYLLSFLFNNFLKASPPL